MKTTICRKALLLLCIPALCLLPACSSSSSSSSDNSSEQESVSYSSAQELLQACWDADTGDKPSILGGYGEAVSESEPMAVDLEANDLSGVSATFAIPESVLNQSTSAASAMNAMMANYFTAVALQLEDGVNVSEAASEIYNSLMNNQWLCGSPEEVEIITWNQYIIAGYGLKDTLEPFMKAALKLLPGSNLEYQAIIS